MKSTPPRPVAEAKPEQPSQSEPVTHDKILDQLKTGELKQNVKTWEQWPTTSMPVRPGVQALVLHIVHYQAMFMLPAADMGLMEKLADLKLNDFCRAIPKRWCVFSTVSPF